MNRSNQSVALFLLLPLLGSQTLLVRPQSPIVQARTLAPSDTSDPTPPDFTLPPGTPLPVRIADNIPMRIGQPIHAELIYPVYDADTLILPEHTHIIGKVIDLRPDHPRRIRAALYGYLTPFRIPVVRFTNIILPDGTSLAFSADPVTDGAPIYRAVAPPPSKGGFIRQEFHNLVAVVRSDAAIFLAPGKADRFVQFVYGEIPYHPQRVAKGTAWTIETNAPLTITRQPEPKPLAAFPHKRHFWEEPAQVLPTSLNDSGKWTIQAYLADPLSSESSKTGQTIKAIVAEPVFNPDHTIAIPQGSTLIGAVTQAKPSRRLGRSGKLSFSFRELTLPDGKAQNVETTLTGADSGQALALSSEGQVKSPPQDKLSIPIFLAALASRPLDHDHNDVGNGLGKDSVGGAAGLGLAGTVIALAGASRNVAAGIGYYGAAVSVYYRWIAHGKKISFPRDTRIVVQANARRSAAIQPDSTRTGEP